MGKFREVGFAKDYGTCYARPFDYARHHWELLNEVAVVFILYGPHQFDILARERI